MKCLSPAVFLLCCLTALQPCFGQTINLDSLWGVWNDSTQPDTNRLKAMQDIAWDGYLFSQPDSAFYFAQMEYDLAEVTNNKKWMASALNTQGVSFYIRGDYAKAIEYYTRGLKIREELGDKTGIASSLNNIGIIYFYQGDYGKAIDYYTRSLKIREELGDKKGIAVCLNNIGNIYYDQGDYAKAFEYYTKSLKIDEELGDKYRITNSLGNIGNIYYDQGDYAKALEYYTKSLKMKEEIGDKNGIATNLNNIGRIYSDQGDYAKAIDYYTRSLKMKEEIGDKNGIAMSLNNIGVIYQRQGDYLNALGKSTKALSIAQEIGAVAEIKAASNLLYDVYKKTGHTAKALEMYELYIQMRDSIINEENTRALVQQEYKYKYEKEQAVSDAKHNEEMNLSAEREKRQQLISYGAGGGLVLVLAFAFLIYNRFKKIQRQKKVIQQKNKHITESITYAERIQQSILPSMGYIENCLDEFFILYKPKDIVSGDFYWVYQQKNGNILIALADCTGHGVPGAFMSMIGTALLNEIIIENGVTKVNTILDTIRTHMISSFVQEGSSYHIRDGMDITLIDLHNDKRTLSFSGAGQQFYLLRDGTFIEVKGNNYPVGYYFGREAPFDIKEMEVIPGDQLYLFTDGIIDQFGGDNDRKFSFKRLKEVILKGAHLPMHEQNKLLDQAIISWKGDNTQTDDISVMGLKIA